MSRIPNTDFFDCAGKTDACSASARSLENWPRAFGHQSSAPGSSASPTRQPMVWLSSPLGRVKIRLSLPFLNIIIGLSPLLRHPMVGLSSLLGRLKIRLSLPFLNTITGKGLSSLLRQPMVGLSSLLGRPMIRLSLLFSILLKGFPHFYASQW